jgi:hypothetical protein
MVMDHYRDRWWPLVPQFPPQFPPQPYPCPDGTVPTTQTITVTHQPAVSQDEVDEFRKLLERARAYDKLHNQEMCELEEKKAALLAIAKALGIDISFL